MELPILRKQNKAYYRTGYKFSVGIELSILTRLRYYIADFFYKQDIDVNNYAASAKQLIDSKVFPASVSSNDFSLRSDVKNEVKQDNPNFDVVSFFSNNKFPFTVCNVGENITLIDEHKNTPGAMARVFCQEFNSYVSVMPITQTFEFVSFFNTAQDYDEVMIKLALDNAILTRIDYPISINNLTYDFTFDLSWEVSKGEYAHDFEGYLEKERIYDIVHTAVVNYTLIIPNNTVAIHPVTDMGISLYARKMDETYGLLYNKLLAAVNNGIHISTNFVNGSTGWVKTSPIVFVFDTPMVESSVIDNITIDPNPTGRWTVSSNCLTFTYTPFGGSFLATTLYTITIPKMKLQAENGYWYKSDVTLTFTTGA